MKKPILNKWQIHLAFHRDIFRGNFGWNYFEFGVFNLKSLPPEGEILRKKHYKGFIIRFYIWFPIARA